MVAQQDIRIAALKADLIRTETVRIEGSLRVIHDLAGMPGAHAAATAALRRVCRAHMNDNDGWIA
jgi:acid phosphatase family membrane protein YuiD